MAMTPNEFTSKANGQAREFKNKVATQEDHLEQLTHSAGERIGAMAADIASTTSEYAKTSREYVRDNPAKTVAIAAIAGVFAGSLLTFAMRRRRD